MRNIINAVLVVIVGKRSVPSQRQRKNMYMDEHGNRIYCLSEAEVNDALRMVGEKAPRRCVSYQ